MHTCTGKGHGNPLQCSCLENSTDKGAWWTAVYGVTQSWTHHTSPGGGSAILTNALKHNPEALEEVDPVVPGQEVKIKDGTFLRLLWSQQEPCKYTWSSKLFKSKTQ